MLAELFCLSTLGELLHSTPPFRQPDALVSIVSSLPRLPDQSVMVETGRGASAGVLVKNAEALELLEKVTP
jgi:hypothetical protein